MKERPILFNGAMVRAVLQGRKTQTRRVIIPNAPRGRAVAHVASEPTGPLNEYWVEPGGWVRCPYGQPGDRLWVRETWRPVPTRRGDFYIQYAADAALVNVSSIAAAREWEKATCPHMEDKRWHPSIHIPRWGSRITLEVTEVRVQRLQEISEEDARAEGVEPVDDPFQEGTEYWRCYESACVKEGGCAGVLSARGSYETLWESINGAGSWNVNPWVWAISFRRLP